jgi:hypothetical protein
MLDVHGNLRSHDLFDAGRLRIPRSRMCAVQESAEYNYQNILEYMFRHSSMVDCKHLSMI